MRAASRPGSSASALAPGRWWILAACCAVAFAQLAEPHLWMIGFDIPSSAFGAAWREYRLLTNLGVVLFVAFLLVGGVLGDLVGRRRIFLIGAVGATLGNTFSLFAGDLPTLVVTRAFAGVLGAMVLPLTLGVIRLIFDGPERTRALVIYAFVTSTGTLAALLGIPLEGWFGWRSTLLLPIAAGLVGIILAWRHLPESRAHGGFGRIEAITAAAWALACLAVFFGLVVARTSGTWRNPITLAAGGVGSTGLLIMVLWTQYAAGKGLFRGGQHLPPHFISMLLLVSATISFSLTGFVLQLYMYFFTVQQLSGFISGVALAPILLGNLFTLRWAARFATEQPSSVAVGSGMLAMGAAILLSAMVGPATPYLLLLPMMVLFGLGFLVTSAAWTYFFFGALPADLVGMSSGINRAAGQVGGALSGVILATVLEVVGMTNFTLRLADRGLSESQQTLAIGALNAILRYGPTSQEVAEGPADLVSLGLMAVYRESYSVGISSALLMAAALCLACAIIAWIWLRSVERAAAEA